MALTTIQRNVCQRIASNRIENGESYIAGGVALNVLLSASRVSRDIDLFHNTQEALQSAWDKDRFLLQEDAYRIEIIRERQTFIEALISKDDQHVLMQWTSDST